jgi:hypothetical protein
MKLTETCSIIGSLDINQAVNHPTMRHQGAEGVFRIIAADKGAAQHTTIVSKGGNQW